MKQRLDQYLFDQGLAQSRSQAAALIMSQKVKVDDRTITKAGYFVKDDCRVEVEEGPQYVSRAGGKLASVADKFGLDFKDKVVLDVGSSTGGFTDYALQNGAKKVYAVDVGTGQLDWSLRQNPKVVSMEKTNILDVLPGSKTVAGSMQHVAGKYRVQEKGNSKVYIDDPIDIVVADVSFVSIVKLVPAIANLMNKNTLFAAMVKPQFEADYVTASKHKGVIKNNTIRRDILKRVEQDLRQHFIVIDKKDSQVKGAKGNTERFYLLKRARRLI